MRLYVVVLLLASLGIAAGNERDYPAGINFMMRDILIEKFREIIVPEVLQRFHSVHVDDIGVHHWYASFKVYNIDASVVPITPDQLEIDTKQDTNSLYTKVSRLSIALSGHAHIRLLFIGLSGYADLTAVIDYFEFEVAPAIIEDGPFNDLSYDILKLNINVLAHDINIKKISIGRVPGWILTPLANAAIHNFQGGISAITKGFSEYIVKVIMEHRGDIPDQVPIPDTSLSLSLSFPNMPKMYNDRIEIPFDGTVFLTQEGYDPQKDHANPMPSYDENDQNNIQFFINQHVLKTDLNAIKKSGLFYEITEDIVAQFALPDKVFTVKYFSLLFPFLSCHYDSDVVTKMQIRVDPDLESEITFMKGGMEGKFSPNLQIYAGNDLALTVMLTAEFTASIDFKVEGQGSYAHGTLDSVKITHAAFKAGTVKFSDLPAIVDSFQNKVQALVKQSGDAILDKGVYLPVFPLVNSIFEIDLEDIDMEFMDEYLKASFTIDIHNRIKMLKAMKKNKNMFRTTSTLEQLLKPTSDSCNVIGE